MSRVKEMSGLFLREKLPTDITLYAVDSSLATMIKKMKTRTPRKLTDEDYALISENLNFS